jgi:hypothetical protein
MNFSCIQRAHHYWQLKLFIPQGYYTQTHIYSSWKYHYLSGIKYDVAMLHSHIISFQKKNSETNPTLMPFFYRANVLAENERCVPIFNTLTWTLKCKHTDAIASFTPSVGKFLIKDCNLLFWHNTWTLLMKQIKLYSVPTQKHVRIFLVNKIQGIIADTKLSKLISVCEQIAFAKFLLRNLWATPVFMIGK